MTYRIKIFIFLILSTFFYGCSEKVDESNMFISNEPTMMDYLNANKNYSDFITLLKMIKFSNNDNASTLANVLSARGNYTCFAPNNKAIREFLELPLDSPIDTSLISDSIAGQITKSCIINNGDDNAYTTPEFPELGAFNKTNLKDRVLMVQLDSATNKYLINSSSLVEKSDIKVSNGYLHLVDKVISPSTKCIPILMENSSNMHIMAKLLDVTSWKDSLMIMRDEKYEAEDIPETGAGLYGGSFKIPQHRYIGFTAFVETDDILHSEWGIDLPLIDEETGDITNWEIIISQITTQCNKAYNSTSSNLKDENNAVNQFVSYHFIRGAYAYNNFVFHYCEYNYQWGNDRRNPQQKNLPVDKWAYYTTLGKQRRLLKITHIAKDPDHPMYINRKTIYNNGPNDDYTEKEVIDGSLNSNVLLLEKNGSEDNNSVNGFIFPIKRVLLYDKFVQKQVLNDRIRFDIAYMLPEMASNKVRNTGIWNFRNDYFDNIINANEETQIIYVCHCIYGTGAWRDLEGDEFNFLGVFDVTLRLPSVPNEGTYELRMGCSNNPLRGMAQAYFGDNPNSLSVTGLPIDLRQEGGSNNPNIPWIRDGKDETVNRETDKNIRNQDYMKSPNYFTECNGKGDITVRKSNLCLRKIITRQRMVPGKSYYLRFKSVLDKSDGQFFVDYFELVPKSIYDNEANPEDIW